MSNALAIAGVTAVLQNLLESLRSQLLTALGINVLISSLAPENVPQQPSDGPCLNLFLYRVSQNSAMRNASLPSVNGPGMQITRPPLAVDLHYLLTAYGNADLHAEVLLGYAMQRMHENPVLTRTTIQSVLNPAVAPTAPVFDALQTTGLAEQLEMIKLSPASLNLDELAKLWTAMKANYRPSAAYQATVVLIESDLPTVTPLPVLSRGPSVVDAVSGVLRETGIGVGVGLRPPLPEIESITFSSGQVAAQLGDTLIVSGHHLDGAPGEYRLLLSNAHLDVEVPIGPETTATPATVKFDLTGPADLPAGMYTAALRLRRPGEQKTRTTNALPLIVAPQFAANPLPASVTLGTADTFTLQPDCITQLRPKQRVSLILGSQEVVADTFAAPTSSPSFTFERMEPDTYWVRLRVDGVDSLLVDRTQNPPAFNGPQLQVQP